MSPLSISSIKNNANILGKYLDQPAFVKKIYDVMPYVLTTTAAGYGAYDTYKSPPKDRKKKMIKNASILGFTVASALIATRGLKIKSKQIFEGIIELPEKNTEGLAETLAENLSSKTKKLVEKIQDDKVLKFGEVKTMVNEFDTKFKDEDLISKVIPAPESEAPFTDLLKLSKLGLIPVLGGIAGGTVGDKLAGENWEKQFPDKVKEGTYQYLNNIALCNVGAGLGALTMNALKVQNKMARVGAMLTGVIGVGLVAGSAIANVVGKEIIDPLFDKNKKRKPLKEVFKNLNSERHPEAMDLSLHIDDLASVPMLYSVSAYRAGIGYRNGEGTNQEIKDKDQRQIAS